MFTPQICPMSCVMCHVTCHVTCHVSHVMCHVSRVTCHNLFFFFSDKVLKLIGGGSVINGAYPVQFLNTSLSMRIFLQLSEAQFIAKPSISQSFKSFRSKIVVALKRKHYFFSPHYYLGILPVLQSRQFVVKTEQVFFF